MTTMVATPLPDGWKITRLGDACIFTKKPRGLSFSTYETVPFVPMELIPIGRTFFDSFIAKAPEAVTSGTYFEPGDVLVSKITPSFENGKQGIIEHLPLPFGVATTEVIPLQEIAGISDRLFLFYYLLRSNVRSELAGKMEGSTGRQRLSASTLSNLDIALPPFSEQRAISRVLRSVQKAIEGRKHELELERERKAALMQYLFAYGTRNEPTKRTELGEVPENWLIVRLGEIVEVCGGKRLPKGESFSEAPTKWPYIRVVDLENGSIQVSDMRYLTSEVQTTIGRYTISKDDVYISIAGTIGLVGTVPEQLDGANLTENAAKLIVKDKAAVHYEFVARFLQSQQGQEQIESYTAKTTQPKLALARIQMIQMPLPTFEEQKEIAAILGACDMKCVALEREVALFDELFQAMLEELMTGRLSVAPLLEGGNDCE